jgi:SpoVK/Ycf46/Vps4 family AAA+-type ATPase
MEQCREGLAIISPAALDNNSRIKAFGPAMIEHSFPYCLDQSLSTVVEIIPSELMQRADDESSRHSMLQTSPCMQFFMINSASQVSNSTVSLLDGEDAISIIMKYSDDDDFYSVSTKSKEFRLKPIDNYIDLTVNRDDCLSWELELKLIFCTDEKYERQLNLLAMNKKKSINENIPVEEGSGSIAVKKMLLRNLEGRFVRSGSVLSVELPQSFGDEAEVAMFLVNHVHKVIDTNADSRQESVQEQEELLTYRLGGCENLSLLLVSDISEDEEDSLIETSIEMTTGQPKSAGYTKLVNEIVESAQISNLAASPSAVLLHGCSGVGKSSLVRICCNLLILNLHSRFPHPDHHSILNVQALTVVHTLRKTLHPSSAVKVISCKDLVLDAYSLSDSSHLLNTILPNENINSKRDTNKKFSMKQIILVIDDLDVIMEVDDEGVTDESRIAMNAVLSAVDNIVSARVSLSESEDYNASIQYLPPFILGICCGTSQSISPNLVRVGRFEKVFTMSPPTELQRREILKELLQSLPIVDSNDADKERIVRQWSIAMARHTSGCVAADIKRICMDAVTRLKAQNETDDLDEGRTAHLISWDMMREAVRSCIPSQLAQLDVTVSRDITDDVTQVSQSSNISKELFNQSWTRFGGYKAMKDRLYRTVVWPWSRHVTEAVNELERPISSLEKQIPPPTGVIFHGPSGTGKTLACETLASSLGLNVVRVRASDVLDQWLGGSEAAIRSLFSRARAAAPCVLFFDEIDSLATNREDDEDGASDVHSRVLSTLLNEMDGVSSNRRESILVVAATNRLSAIDAALLRPGRLEQHFLLDNPVADDIVEILASNLADTSLHPEINLMELAVMLHQLEASSAVVKGICTEACIHAMGRFDLESDVDNVALEMEDFDVAIVAWKR